MADGGIKIRMRIELPEDVLEYLETKGKKEMRMVGEIAAEELTLAVRERRLKGEL